MIISQILSEEIISAVQKWKRVGLLNPEGDLAPTNGVKEDSSIYWTSQLWSSPDLTTSPTSIFSPFGAVTRGDLAANYSGFIALDFTSPFGGVFRDHVNILPVADGISGFGFNIAQGVAGTPQAITFSGTKIDTSTDLSNGGLESFTLTFSFSEAVQLNMGTASNGGNTWTLQFNDLSELSGLTVTANSTNLIQGALRLQTFDRALGFDDPALPGGAPLLESTNVIDLYRDFSFRAQADTPASVSGPALTVNEDGSNNVVLSISDPQGISNVQVLNAPQLSASVSDLGDGNYQINLSANDPNFSGDTVVDLRITDSLGLVTDVSRVVSINPIADGFNSLAAANDASAAAGQSIALNISGLAIDTSNSLASGGLESHVLQITFDSAVSLNQGVSNDGGITWEVSFNNISELAGLAFTSNILGAHSYSAVIRTTDAANVSAGAASNIKVSEALVGSFQIISANLNPTISLDSGLPAIFIENNFISTPIDLLPNVVDPDSADGRWDNAVLTVQIGNPEAGDKISIVSLFKVTVSGSNVLYNNVVVGSLAGSTDTALKITFNSNATSQVVEDVARQIFYANRSDDPSAGVRQGVRDIQYQISDGDGGISNIAHKNVVVYGVNDAPQIAVNDADKVVQAARGQWLNLGAMNIFTITDKDASSTSLYKVTVSVDRGLLDIDTTGLNVIFAQDPGTGRASLTFTGTLNDINIALDRLMYRSMSKGTDTLCISVIDLNTNNFLGGIQTDTDALKIKVA